MSIFEGVHALIIEDEQTSIEVLRNLLWQLAVSATVIESTPTIMDDLRGVERPDVVFLDLEMPTPNGYQVLSELRADRKFEGVPIIAYTTHISHMNDARRAGFDGFLGKPVNRMLFPDNLMRILNGESIWEAP